MRKTFADGKYKGPQFSIFYQTDCKLIPRIPFFWDRTAIIMYLTSTKGLGNYIAYSFRERSKVDTTIAAGSYIMFGMTTVSGLKLEEKEIDLRSEYISTIIKKITGEETDVHYDGDNLLVEIPGVITDTPTLIHFIMYVMETSLDWEGAIEPEEHLIQSAKQYRHSLGQVSDESARVKGILDGTYQMKRSRNFTAYSLLRHSDIPFGDRFLTWNGEEVPIGTAPLINVPDVEIRSVADVRIYLPYNSEENYPEIAINVKGNYIQPISTIHMNDGVVVEVEKTTSTEYQSDIRRVEGRLIYGLMDTYIKGTDRIKSKSRRI